MDLQYQLAHLFRDVHDMLNPSRLAYDELSESVVIIPRVPFLIVGADCGTLSKLNRKRPHHDCITSGEGSTGHSFDLFHQFIQLRHGEIEMCLFENVPSILEEKSGSSPLCEAKALLAKQGFELPYYSVLSAMSFGGDAQSRCRFYGPFYVSNLAVLSNVWDLCLATLSSPADQCAQLSEHILPSSDAARSNWLTKHQMRKGTRPRPSEKEAAQAKEFFEAALMPWPPPSLQDMGPSELQSIGIPYNTAIFADCLEVREQHMLIYFSEACCRSEHIDVVISVGPQ